MQPDKEIIITIRRMTAEDLSQIEPIENEAFSTPWKMSTYETILKDNDYDCIVAECEGCVAGYMTSLTTMDSSDVTNIAVKPEFRRLGIADQLMNCMYDILIRRNSTELFLEVRESNTPARTLYTKHNFEEIGIRRAYYRNPTEDAVIMKKGLIC